MDVIASFVAFKLETNYEHGMSKMYEPVVTGHLWHH